MAKIEFDMHRLPARKDLLHFVEEHEGDGIYTKIGENPRAWIDELNIVNQLLTRKPISGGGGLEVIPIEEEDAMKLGEGVYLYRGKHRGSRGLWIRNENARNEDERFNWTQYRLSTNTAVRINSEFNWIKPELLLPENFGPISKAPEGKENGKRPVMVFNLEGRTIYAKGADTGISFYYSGAGPGYRLTSIAGISRTTSEKELQMTQDFMNLGIRVPEIVGINESDIEPYLFLLGIEGKSPDNYFTTHRNSIIDQDADILAKMCLGGYRKHGFTDFDDKIFDGTNLHLIDVDECRDLYFVNAVNYREVLLNPLGGEELEKFRETQKSMFESSLSDAIYNYRRSLTPDRQSQERYVMEFHRTLGWETPDPKKMDELLDFKGDYTTLDSYLSMMADTD